MEAGTDMLGSADSNSGKSVFSGGSSGNRFYQDPYLGEDFDGLYHIDEKIGSGSWGNVYKASALNGGASVAVKIVHNHHLKDECSIKRFELEAKSLSKVQSRYVVKIISHGFEPAPYIAMEHFDGIPLSNWIRDNGPMKPAMAIEFFMQLCEGLNAFESINIIHRDLKPSNILLKVDGEKLETRILDFGLAKSTERSLGAESLTATGEILGSPPYMSPEHWKGQCDSRSDIYSLGCIMYEVLTGRPPFKAQFGMDYMSKHVCDKPARISEANPGVNFPEALEDVVSKCLQKNPAKRYQSSDACAIDLRKIKNGIAPKIMILDDVLAKHKKLIGAALLLCLTIIAGIFIFKSEIVHSACSYLYSQQEKQSAAGCYRSSLEYNQYVLSISQLLPDADLQKLRALRSLESYYREQKQFDLAMSFEKKIDVLIGRVNSDPDIAMLAYQIQRTMDAKNIEQAESLAHLALKMSEKKLGKCSMAYAACLNYVGSMSYRKGKYEDAAHYYRQSLATAQVLLEPDNFRIPEIMDHLSMALNRSGQEQEAQEVARASEELKANQKVCLTAKVPANKKEDLVLWDFPEESEMPSVKVAGSAESTVRLPIASKAGKLALLSDVQR